jgi:hypothetical protein
MCHYAEVKKTGPARNTRQTNGRKGRNTGMEVLLASRDERNRYEIFCPIISKIY